MAEKNLEEMREAVEAIREKMAAAARASRPRPRRSAALCGLQDPHRRHRCCQRGSCHSMCSASNHVQELAPTTTSGALLRRSPVTSSDPFADQQNQEGAGPRKPHPERGQRASAGRHRKGKPPRPGIVQASCWK